MPTKLEMWLLFGYFACVIFQTKKRKMSESSILRYNLIISKRGWYLISYCKKLSNWTENNQYFINQGLFVITHFKKSTKYGYHLWEPHFPH